MQSFNVSISDSNGIHVYPILATRPDVAVSKVLKMIGTSHSTLMNTDYKAPVRMKVDETMTISIKRIS